MQLQDPRKGGLEPPRRLPSALLEDEPREFKMAREGLDPISRAFFSSSGAAPGPKEGRFGTAQALAKRLSLRTHRESSKWRERGWVKGHDSPAFMLLPIIHLSRFRSANP